MANEVDIKLAIVESKVEDLCRDMREVLQLCQRTAGQVDVMRDQLAKDQTVNVNAGTTTNFTASGNESVGINTGNGNIQNGK